LFKESKVHLIDTIKGEVGTGYQGIKKIHSNSEIPKKTRRKTTHYARQKG
jgi:hypothetical protein